MNYKKGSFLVWAIIILAVIIVGGTGYVYTLNRGFWKPYIVSVSVKPNAITVRGINFRDKPLASSNKFYADGKLIKQFCCVYQPISGGSVVLDVSALSVGTHTLYLDSSTGRSNTVKFTIKTPGTQHKIDSRFPM